MENKPQTVLCTGVNRAYAPRPQKHIFLGMSFAWACAGCCAEFFMTGSGITQDLASLGLVHEIFSPTD